MSDAGAASKKSHLKHAKSAPGKLDKQQQEEQPSNNLEDSSKNVNDLSALQDPTEDKLNRDAGGGVVGRKTPKDRSYNKNLSQAGHSN